MATAEFSKFTDWHIECSALTSSCSGIWNSSAGILSLPLVLFIVMLPKAHLSSHSRMSGSRWVTTPSWLSGPLRSFLYSSSVYSCHPFLISPASVRSLRFCPLCYTKLYIHIIKMNDCYIIIFIIFVFYYCITNYHKPSILTQHRFVIWQNFVGQGGVDVSSAQISQGWNQAVGQPLASVLIWRLI